MSEHHNHPPIQPTAGSVIDLAEFDPASRTGDGNRDQIEPELNANIEAMEGLASRLYAESKQALLLILQGMDTSGKDGTIRNVMRGFNPLLCRVVPFKAPNEDELAHDFLWRIHRQTPRRGQIGIFNRSHYEDVVVVRVRKWISKKECRRRYRIINDFERMLVREGTVVVKCFLHISKDEQRRRLQARIDDPQKRWKFRRDDLEDRKLWPRFQRVYSDALTACNTRHAPWHIVPADSKPQRDLIISRILRNALEEMNPQYPPHIEGIDKIVVK
ncbi:MAG: polyphosphate kinase 2 family protein [Pirellulales bacterium]|nr:polyphosphate kinase 2 family protein [Pirellulales bacterium]